MTSNQCGIHATERRMQELPCPWCVIDELKVNRDRLQQCHREGWLHAQEVEDEYRKRMGHGFGEAREPSSVDRIISWLLVSAKRRRELDGEDSYPADQLDAAASALVHFQEEDRIWEKHSLVEIVNENERLRAKLNPANRESPHCSTCACGMDSQAPIAKLIIGEDGMVAWTGLYAPGLPPGDHDLFCEPTDRIPAVETFDYRGILERVVNRWEKDGGVYLHEARTALKAVETSQLQVIQHVYTRGGKAAVCGIPGEDHDCDAMACSSVEHILARVPHTVDEPAEKASDNYNADGSIKTRDVVCAQHGTYKVAITDAEPGDCPVCRAPMQWTTEKAKENRLEGSISERPAGGAPNADSGSPPPPLKTNDPASEDSAGAQRQTQFDSAAGSSAVLTRQCDVCHTVHSGPLCPPADVETCLACLGTGHFDSRGTLCTPCAGTGKRLQVPR